MNLMLTVAALAAIGFAYVRWVRPRAKIAFPEFYAALEAREASAWACLVAHARKFWDVSLAVALAVGPEIPGILTELGAVDLSGLVPSDTATLVSKLIGLALVACRILQVVRTAKRRAIDGPA